MFLENIIDISKKEIITVVGAGGKTSFINYLSEYYRNKCRVLMTTTTKIYKPKENQYDNIYMTKDIKKINLYQNNGLTVVGKYINSENKIIGLETNELETIENYFDLILIEGDGSKKKKLKGWKNYEPVVYHKTTKTVGILDITSYGMDVNSENIHNLKEFLDLTNINEEKIGLNHFKHIILSKNGLFKNSFGEKILFLNKVESEEFEKIALDLINLINKENHNIVIFYGSIKNNYYKVG